MKAILRGSDGGRSGGRRGGEAGAGERGLDGGGAQLGEGGGGRGVSRQIASYFLAWHWSQPRVSFPVLKVVSTGHLRPAMVMK